MYVVECCLIGLLYGFTVLFVWLRLFVTWLIVDFNGLVMLKVVRFGCVWCLIFMFYLLVYWLGLGFVWMNVAGFTVDYACYWFVLVGYTFIIVLLLFVYYTFAFTFAWFDFEFAYIVFVNCSVVWCCLFGLAFYLWFCFVLILLIALRFGFVCMDGVAWGGLFVFFVFLYNSGFRLVAYFWILF